MEYTDYRTRKPISREQYIINGLGRGELLVKLDCGCVVIQDRTVDAYIVYCSLHQAAPDLYEACKQALRTFEVGNVKSTDPRYLMLRQAIAKAEK